MSLLKSLSPRNLAVHHALISALPARRGIRRLGDHASHDHHHHHDAPEALFLGEAKNRVREAWEIPTYISVFFAGVVTAVGLWNAPDTRLTHWASVELDERERRKAAGEEVEFGHNYAAEKVRESFKRR